MLALIAYAQAYLQNLGVTDEDGQGMVEYVMIIGTISLIVVAAFLTGGIENAITGLSSKVASAIN